MEKKSYQKRLEEHLSVYKIRRLGILENGTYKYRDRMREYGHILPRRLAWLTIPEPFRLEIRDYVERERISLHECFHHLNSSQAFAFSLFIPYLMNAREIVQSLVGDSPITEWQLEKIVDVEEGTNVDVWWQSFDGIETYCEIKLAESGFGTADNDARHRHKLETLYRKQLLDCVDPELLEPKVFFANYQILRNLWLVCRQGHERDKALFLMPKSNIKPIRKLQWVLDRLHPSLLRRIHVADSEQLVAKLADGVQGRELSWYGRVLSEKYLVS